jgi:hypothetical protein
MKFSYKIKNVIFTIVHPSYWISNWGFSEDLESFFIRNWDNPFIYKSKYTACFCDVVIWTSNHPMLSFSCDLSDRFDEEKQPSNLTRHRLMKKLEKDYLKESEGILNGKIIKEHEGNFT